MTTLADWAAPACQLSSESAEGTVTSTSYLQSGVRKLGHCDRQCNLDVLVELRCASSTRDDRNILASDNVVESEAILGTDPYEFVGLDHDVVGFTMNLAVYTKNSRVIPLLSEEKFELEAFLAYMYPLSRVLPETQQRRYQRVS